MSILEKRIENLENHIGTKQQVVIIVRREGDNTEPTEEQKEARITKYQAKNPDRKEGDIIVLRWKDGQFK